MVEERTQRHLAAILSADVAGYTRLMEQDETDTFARLKAHRKELFEPEIEKHGGRVFKLTGDGLWPSSAAWSMRLNARLPSNAAWPSATRMWPTIAASMCGLA